MNLNQIAALLNAAYADMIGDNFDHEFVVGCIAEAKALAEGDTGSFDHAIDDPMAQRFLYLIDNEINSLHYLEDTEGMITMDKLKNILA